MIAKDFFGNDLQVGNTVAFMQLNYRSLKQGTIIKITDKIVFIEHEKFNVGGNQTKQAHDQVIKKI